MGAPVIPGLNERECGGGDTPREIRRFDSVRFKFEVRFRLARARPPVSVPESLATGDKAQRRSISSQPCHCGVRNPLDRSLHGGRTLRLIETCGYHPPLRP